MSLADVPLQASTDRVDVPAPSAQIDPKGPVREPGQPVPATVAAFRRGMAQAGQRPRLTGRQRLAWAFAIAWILCPAIEPMPSGHLPAYPLWQLPIDLAAIGSITAAVVVLWRGGRNGARLGVAAGVLMAVETIICPIAGHTPVGWWTWTQAALSAFVLFTSLALLGRRESSPTR
jgi:hypothetical protein